VADLFRAAVAFPLGIFPLHNTFDLFGLDFMVDTVGKLWLLEVNSDPSLSIFEERLRDACAAMLDDAVGLVTSYVAGVRSVPTVGDCESPYETDGSSVVGDWHRVLVVPPRWSPEDGRRRLGSLIKVCRPLTQPCSPVAERSPHLWIWTGDGVTLACSLLHPISHRVARSNWAG
jgi:hypothetical protein